MTLWGSSRVDGYNNTKRENSLGTRLQQYKLNICEWKQNALQECILRVKTERFKRLLIDVFVIIFNYFYKHCKYKYPNIYNIYCVCLSTCQYRM